MRFDWSADGLTALADCAVLLGLPSPNGATLCAEAGDTARVLLGCLRNARAVAARAAAIGGPVGVLAAGERWGSHDSPLRPAVEDQLGAGAIIAALAATVGVPSPEARFAAAGFGAERAYLPATLRASVSGRELIEGGHGGDVELAAELDACTAVPELRDGVLRG